MANQAQKDAVVKLHGLNDGSDITATYGDGGYTIGHTDPYELAAAIATGGNPVTAVVATNDTDISVDGGTSASTILITYYDGTTSTDVADAVWAEVSILLMLLLTLQVVL